MSRKDALLKLHERLTLKRNALKQKMTNHMDISRRSRAGVGDMLDAASRGSSTELNTQLAALESRELKQVDQAIEMIREGRYGKCNVCDRSIPITRLKALPFTPCCIGCQRKLEVTGGEELEQALSWESAYEHEGRMRDSELTLKDIDID